MTTAIITGASMGLGEQFARQLAARGVDLLLVARSAERLDKLTAELAASCGIRARALPCDLARPGAAETIEAFVAAEGIEPAWLINNAGLGEAGAFEQMDPACLESMLMVNVVSLTALTRRLLPRLRGAGGARIINVASQAAFQPVPWFAAYGAAKAYVLSFSEALHEELRGAGVTVTCLCPGPTATDFNRNNAIEIRSPRQSQSAAEVVRLALEGSDRGKAVVVCQGKLMLIAQRLAPRALVRRVAGELTRKNKRIAK